MGSEGGIELQEIRLIKMKYEQQLLFNAQSEWTDYYIAYSTLKNAVYKAEKEALQYSSSSKGHVADDDEERGGLLADDPADNTDTTSSEVLSNKFRKLCDAELAKIEAFYADKEKELLDQLTAIQDEVEQVEQEGEFGDLDEGESGDEESGESGDENDGLIKRGQKLIRSVVAPSTSGKKRDSSDEERGTALGRRRSSSIPARQRKRSHGQGSDASEGGSSNFESGLQRTPSAAPETLPADAVQDIDEQLDRTMQAAAGDPDAGRPNGKMPLTKTLSNSAGQIQDPVSPYSGGGASRRRGRAMSFSGAASSTNDIWSSNSRQAVDLRITFKLRLQSLFRDLSQLKEYVSLNQTGFRKILKKFDKVTESNLQKAYMKEVVSKAYPFKEETQAHLDEALQSLIPLYGKIVTRGDPTEALRQLRIQLREHVVWERNTIWREMIGLERKGWSGGGSGGGARRASTGGAGVDKPIVKESPAHADEHVDTFVSTPVGRLRVPRWVTKETLGGTIALLAFVGILSSNLFDRVEERNCLAILVLASIFWAMEVVPLFATSLLVPFLIVVLRVLKSTDGHETRLTATEASKYIFSQMFTGTIVLLVGGFTLAGALSKQNIDKILASRVLALAGVRPARVLIAYMGVACFASMWISNVAAPVLCFSLIQPILRTLPPRSSYSKALVLGIALASNLGGMASPIASPQNLIAISYMSEPLSWAQWFAISLPVAAISIFAIWGLLCWLYSWDRGITINPVRPTKEKFTSTQWFVCAVTLGTVALLCVEHQLEGVVGDMGIIALIPLVVFFGTGILRKQDFDNFPWSIVFLAMGGIALGKGVLSSGLLADLDTVLEQAVKGLDVWPILAIFSFLALIVATFVSHSIASVLVAPIAAQIGAALDPPHPRLLIMATALICSAGMALPVSGFPNLMAVNLEDEVGNRYLTVNDFLKAGIPASLLATIVIITVGYLLMRLIGL